ncbi:hypothetical protein MFFC18_02200 [Mariniblastus fucicola]|uniref:Pirin n=1 Tax=Mariniblastus fucicola TaxID=980251 RepID=A0A5B9P5W4_9BACT|nr:hypothetical protein MFFC18_02200 [Mariniblastus fucicola]
MENPASGKVQRRSAGTGITHSELNPSQTEPTIFIRSGSLPNAKEMNRAMSRGGLQMRSDTISCDSSRREM